MSATIRPATRVDGGDSGQALPLAGRAGDPFAVRAGRLRTLRDFRQDANLVENGAPYVVNLCADRYAFLVALTSAVNSGRTTLLPPSGAPAVVAETRSTYGDCAIVDDKVISDMLCARKPAAGAATTPAPDFVVAIGHTSGSTGIPTAHRKTWSALRATSARNAAAIRRLLPSPIGGGRPWIVATVPSQHMYGFELAVLLPLLEGFSIHAGQPLYPGDVAQALREVPAPRILVSTPVHLRALARSGIAMPQIALVVSATAPLAQELAAEVEARFDAPLLEMFGSTETCVLATRRTTRDAAWTPYAGVRLEPTSSGTFVHAPWLPESTVLQDVVEPGADGFFTVAGRNTDMVEVAGKRASLADLTRRLGAVPGVQDCFVLQTEEPDALGVRRLAALVVAPGLTSEQVAAGLRPSVDPVFMPRPLLLVEALPRNEVGKIPRQRALDWIRDAEQWNPDAGSS